MYGGQSSKDFLVSSYADDTAVFARGLDSVARLITLLQKFKHAFGLEINIRKTECGSASGRIKPIRLLVFAGHGI